MARFEALKRFGFLVLSFESNRPMPRGAKGMTDYLIIGNRFKGDIYFVERKFKGDKMRKEQSIVAEYLDKSGNYFMLDEKNEAEIIQQILDRKKK